MKLNKYIIRNCPCFVEGIAIKGNEQKTQTCNNHKIRELTLCQDCTDCVLKQIVELAKGHTELCKNCEQQIKECDCSDICNAYRLNKILQLLDIQEGE
jgi:hypothetical protein